MVSCLAQSARAPALGQDESIPFLETPACVAPAVEMAGTTPYALKSVLDATLPSSRAAPRRRWTEVAFVAAAAIGLVLVPSVQSLGLSVDSGVAAKVTADAATPVSFQVQADSLAADEVASIISAG